MIHGKDADAGKLLEAAFLDTAGHIDQWWSSKGYSIWNPEGGTEGKISRPLPTYFSFFTDPSPHIFFFTDPPHIFLFFAPPPHINFTGPPTHMFSSVPLAFFHPRIIFLFWPPTPCIFFSADPSPHVLFFWGPPSPCVLFFWGPLPTHFYFLFPLHSPLRFSNGIALTISWI